MNARPTMNPGPGLHSGPATNGVPAATAGASTTGGLSSIALFHQPLEPLGAPVARPIAGITTTQDLTGPSVTNVWDPARRQTPSIDWNLVVDLRGRASAEVAERCTQQERATGSRMDPADRRMLGRSVVQSIVTDHADRAHRDGAESWPLERERAYTQAVFDAIFGYGRLQPLFELPDAENIEITGCESVRVQHPDGRRSIHPPVADSDAGLIDAVRFLGQNAEPTRPFDDAHPTMTLALGDRFRLHAIGFGLSHRPSVVIRQHTMTEVTLDELAAGGLMPPELASFLHAAVLDKRSIVISGDQGAGKTTLLRALIAAIPAQERFATIETDYELLTHLLPGRDNILALQSRLGAGEVLNGQRIGEVTVADLIPEALRQNLTRLIVGEVRGVEARAMFEAMQAGAGSMSSVHAHSAAATVDRLAVRVAHGGEVLIDEAYAQIAANLDLVVHVGLIDDTWRGGRRHRQITQVRYLTGGRENGIPITHVVFRAAADNDGPAGFFPLAELEQAFERYRSWWPA